jgi:hypothetical protein
VHDVTHARLRGIGATPDSIRGKEKKQTESIDHVPDSFFTLDATPRI